MPSAALTTFVSAITLVALTGVTLTTRQTNINDLETNTQNMNYDFNITITDYERKHPKNLQTTLDADHIDRNTKMELHHAIPSNVVVQKLSIMDKNVTAIDNEKREFVKEVTGC
jgi:hypothetical protein